MKLNIGCGFNKLDGYLNVDQFPECAPDVLWNLEQTPWPFEESSVDEMVAHHVLEHLGQETKVFFAVMQELYRLMRHDGLIRITVPHPNHPTFQSDPTHVRAFTYETFEMMNRAKNLDWAARNVNCHHAGVNARHQFRDRQCELKDTMKVGRKRSPLES